MTSKLKALSSCSSHHLQWTGEYCGGPVSGRTACCRLTWRCMAQQHDVGRCGMTLTPVSLSLWPRCMPPMREMLTRVSPVKNREAKRAHHAINTRLAASAGAGRGPIKPIGGHAALRPWAACMVFTAILQTSALPYLRCISATPPFTFKAHKFIGIDVFIDWFGYLACRRTKMRWHTGPASRCY